MVWVFVYMNVCMCVCGVGVCIYECLQVYVWVWVHMSVEARSWHWMPWLSTEWKHSSSRSMIFVQGTWSFSAPILASLPSEHAQGISWHTCLCFTYVLGFLILAQQLLYILSHLSSPLGIIFTEKAEVIWKIVYSATLTTVSEWSYSVYSWCLIKAGIRTVSEFWSWKLPKENVEAWKQRDILNVAHIIKSLRT